MLILQLFDSAGNLLGGFAQMLGVKWLRDLFVMASYA
jgi:hypothetical protein